MNKINAKQKINRVGAKWVVISKTMMMKRGLDGGAEDNKEDEERQIAETMTMTKSSSSVTRTDQSVFNLFVHCHLSHSHFDRVQTS